MSHSVRYDATPAIPTTMQSDEDERVALLDEIAEQLEVALAHPNENEDHAAIPEWMRQVLTLLETAPELVHDALELLAMLLTACQALQGQNAQHAIDIALESKSVDVVRTYTTSIQAYLGSDPYCGALVLQILQSLVRSLQKSSQHEDELQERFEFACSIGYKIIRCVRLGVQMSRLLGVWRCNSSELTDLLKRYSCAVPSLPKRTRVQASYLLCFAAEAVCDDIHQAGFLASSIRTYDTLQRFTASRDQSAVRSWMTDSWESRWRLFDCSRATAITQVLGLPHQSLNAVMDILEGLSIPQIEADMDRSDMTTVRFLASLDLDSICDVRHGVDVTLVKNGNVHPEYAESDAVIRLPELLQAFSAGYTIGIRGVQARSLSVSKLCAALQRDLQQYANANIYCMDLLIDCYPFV